MDAILFVGHGSKDPEGNQEVLNFVHSLVPRLHVPVVETCFLEFEQPTVAQGIKTCVERGATHILIVPLMLFAAGHAKLHIPAEIDGMQRMYPHVSFTYGKPIGVHPHLIELLYERFGEAVEGRTEGKGVDRVSGKGLDEESSRELSKETSKEPGKEPEVQATNPAETAVLLVGRGSSDIDANSDLYKISRLFWEKSKLLIVETAFMGVTSPSVDEGVSRCLTLGAKRVVILPYLLFTGVLMKRLETYTKRYQTQYPFVDFALGRYFGVHRLLQKVVLERIQEAVDGEVRMSCDLCQYRMEALQHHHHHHHHEHEHDHGHEHHHEHDHKSTQVIQGGVR